MMALQGLCLFALWPGWWCGRATWSLFRLLQHSPCMRDGICWSENAANSKATYSHLIPCPENTTENQESGERKPELHSSITTSNIPLSTYHFRPSPLVLLKGFKTRGDSVQAACGISEMRSYSGRFAIAVLRGAKSTNRRITIFDHSNSSVTRHCLLIGLNCVFRLPVATRLVVKG